MRPDIGMLVAADEAPTASKGVAGTASGVTTLKKWLQQHSWPKHECHCSHRRCDSQLRLMAATAGVVATAGMAGYCKLGDHPSSIALTA